MLTRPAALTDDHLVRAVRDGWGVTATSIDYRPVGFGSHHWELVDPQGARWFLTVDELGPTVDARDPRVDAAFVRLGAALSTAVDLHRAGCAFVVAPLLTRSGDPLLRVGQRFALALYPYIDGERFSWSDFGAPEHRRAVLELVAALHAVSKTAAPHAVVDDFAIALRDELVASLEPVSTELTTGPYARAASALMIEHAERIRALLVRYDRGVTIVKAESAWPSNAVLTHGEPHPGNTMRTRDGWVLIDWDTVLIAPPERDLWSLDPGDGSLFRAYTQATGVVPLPSALALYRLRWDLADIAVYVSRFRNEHTGGDDDEKSWDNLCSLAAGLPD